MQSKKRDKQAYTQEKNLNMNIDDINRDASNVPIYPQYNPTILELQEGAVNRFQYEWENGNLDALLLDKNSDTLVVSFHGAVDRKTTNIPRFERLNTLKQLEVSSLFFGDPTLFADENLSLSWYTGWPSINMHKLIARWIVQIVEKLNIRNVILSGSSGGGFAAMQISSYIPNSIAVAFNAQTDISRYLVNGTGYGAQRNYLQSVHPELWKNVPETQKNNINIDWTRHFDSRVSAVQRYAEPMSNYLYLIENDEEFHFEDHYLPLVDTLKKFQAPGRYRCHTYHGGPVHNPPPMNIFLQYITLAIDWAKTNPPVSRSIKIWPAKDSWFDKMSDRVSGDDIDYDKRLTDKLFFSDFCAVHNIETPRIISVYEEFYLGAELPDTIPFVIKPVGNSSGQGVLILEPHEQNYRCLRTSKILTREDIYEYYRRFYDKYDPINRTIIVEEKIFDRGKFPIPRDFKFYVAGGRVVLVQCIDRNRTPIAITWFDEEFNRISDEEIRVNPAYAQRASFARPIDADLLIDEALRIAKIVQSSFIRVDIYTSPAGPICGEVTFTPGGPYYEKTDIFSDSIQLELGKLWNQNTKRKNS